MKGHRARRRVKNESGFVLIWGAILFVPVFLAGMIFLLYGKANVTKAEAQLMAVGLAHIGAYSAEFDSKDSLNLMAAFAHASGFPSDVEPESLVAQSFGDYGQLKFVHDTEAVGFHSVHAYVELAQDPISALLSHIANIQTSSFASTKPEDIYISLTIDNSKSLVKDYDITDLLCAFGVSDCDSIAVPGINGMVPPVPSLTNSPEVWPLPGAQIALPFLEMPHYSTPRIWQELTSEFPQYNSYNNTCTTLPETGCGAYPADHREAEVNRQTDRLMAYKKVATLLTGVVGQITAFTDVTILSNPQDKASQYQINSGLVGEPSVVDLDGDPVTNPLDYSNLDAGIPSGYDFGSTYYMSPQNFYIFLNRGVYPIWRYDQDVRTNLQDGSGGQLAVADIAGTRSRENPRNMFRDSVSMMPDNVLQSYLLGTWSRKKATYGTFYRDTARTDQVTFPNNDYKEWFFPALPVFEDPPSDFWPPTDSFVFSPGARDAVTDAFPHGNPNAPYTWPWFPSPLYAETGPAYPTDDELPVDMKHSFAYLCQYGVRTDMNRSLSIVAGTDDDLNLRYGTPERGLCKIKNFCNMIANQKNNPNGPVYIDVDCDGLVGGPVETGVLTTYFNTDRPRSPRCTVAGGEEGPGVPKPRCYPDISNLSTMDPTAIPVCIRGKLYCVGERSYDVTRKAGCFVYDDNTPDTWDGTFVGVVPSVEAGDDPLTQGVQPICDPGHGLPVGTVHPPSHYRRTPAPVGEDPIQVTAADGNSPFYQGSMAMPNSAPTIEHNSLFYFIMDMAVSSGGTWTGDAVKYAIARSQSFDPERRVMLLITDGRPEPTLSSGDIIYSDDDYLDQLEAS
ncbi:MAG: hypothetical protein KDD55_06505, partial [Bdellovibrionales bacterium]|nr:hypothetical protein [Bdellovibrionales bacterium]